MSSQFLNFHLLPKIVCWTHTFVTSGFAKKWLSSQSKKCSEQCSAEQCSEGKIGHQFYLGYYSVICLEWVATVMFTLHVKNEHGIFNNKSFNPFLRKVTGKGWVWAFAMHPRAKTLSSKLAAANHFCYKFQRKWFGFSSVAVYQVGVRA